MAPSIFGRFFTPNRSKRMSGRPTSSNGASSFHVYWDAPPEPLRSVAVTLTVNEPPKTPDLFFWALQVSFLNGDRRTGAAHLGLQHHTGYPGSAAANWGGYHEAGGELSGELLLPSAMGNPNTCDFGWVPGNSYRLRVEPGPVSGWRGSVTDLSTNVTTVLRDLEGGGDALASPMVWSEVFADCSAPTVAVRWSDPVVETVAGYMVPIERGRTNYQTEANGGCSNTNIEGSDQGVLQMTSIERVVESGSIVRFE